MHPPPAAVVVGGGIVPPGAPRRRALELRGLGSRVPGRGGPDSPGLVARRARPRGRVPVGALGGVLAAHRPLILSLAFSARRSRSASATSFSRPGTEESLVEEAVFRLTVLSPKARMSGPAVTSTNWIRP